MNIKKLFQLNGMLKTGCILLPAFSFNPVFAEGDWQGYEVEPLQFSSDNLADTDGDGVIDARDDCENVNADAVVSNKGCSKDQEIIAETVLDIEFNSDDWHVDKKYYPELKRFSDFYKEHPGDFVSIEGHTDSTGDAAHNLKLSQFRAQAVVKLLTDNYGFDEHKISWVGYGETKPVGDNKTKAGRKENRRIVAVIRSHELHEIRRWSVD
jgi:OOP family OmpA-OmpF porin